MSIISYYRSLKKESTNNLLYFFAGDSYVRGNPTYNLISDLPSQYKGSFPLVKVWTGATFETLDTSVNNNTHPVEQRANSFSYHMIFAIDKTIKTGKTVYLSTYGYGGSRLEKNVSASDWDTESEGEFFDVFKTQMTDTITWMSTNVGDYQMKHLNITLGNNDAAQGTISTIEENLISLVNGLRNNINNIIPTTLNRTIDRVAAGNTQQESDDTRAAIENAVNQLGKCEWVDLDPYEVSPDNVHLSVNGLIGLGQYLSTVI